MGTEYFIVVFVCGLAGGFFFGVAGLGTGITALGIWLYGLSPTIAATLVVICSVAAQIQTLPKIWQSIEPKRVAPFILPGIIGVPVGTALLSFVDVQTFKLAIGALLLLYSLHSLLHRSRSPISWGGSIADGAIGFGGGILGGLAGLSGPLPTVWADIRGWTKEQRRSVFQVFNLTILCAAIVSHFFAGLITRELGFAVAVALPGTFIGAWMGVSVYARVSDKRFKEIILTLLFISGLALVWTNI
jgi:uncharacterized membrane protein YfcA